MKKREFLKSLGLGLLGAASRPSLALGAPPVASPPATRLRPPKNWIWITPEPRHTRDEWKKLFEQMRVAGIDAVVPEVYDGRHAYWDSTRLPVKEDLLSMFLELGEDAGLEVHAWMWTMPCMVDEILKKHPDWYSVNAKGESAAVKPAYVPYYKFLDPARPEVREWIQGTVKELANFATLTGVHLDYVRHPDAILPKGLWAKYNLVQDRVFPEFDYGYSEYSRNEFKKKHGIDPLKIKDKESHKEWMQYRWDSVTELVNGYCVPAARDRGRLITAAVFPGPTLAKQMVRQDWGQWKLDAFLPMIYANFYEAGPEWVKKQTEEGVATVKVPIYTGLYIPETDGPGLTAMIDASLAGGASGVSLFSLGGMNDEKWKALTAATRTPAPAEKTA